VRVIAMTGMLAVAICFAATEGLRPGGGGELFVWLHRTLLCLVWFLVPLMTADVISGERREGTLGLLFLTPLTAWRIVVAKSMAHGLRALTFCLAVLPVLTLPFLAGGVSWMEAVISALFILGSLCCALGAGVLASSSCRSWSRSTAWAGLLAGTMFVIFLWAHLIGALVVVGRFLPGFTWEDVAEHTFELFVAAMAYAVNWDDLWQNMLSTWFVGAGLKSFLVALGAMTIFAFLLLLIMLRLAARNVRRTWQDKPRPPWQLWLEKTFCRPVLLRETLRRWLRWKLEHNPVGWLEQRTWSARLMSWSWLAVLISVYSVALTDLQFYRNHFQRVQNVLAVGLFLSMAAAAAGSFRRERDNGVLQLLLVSPLKVGQIVGGRLRGLWGQFLPAMLLLLGVWAYIDEAVFGSLWWRRQSTVDTRFLFYASSYVCTPIIGLYFSLRERAYAKALLATVAMAALFPFAGLGILNFSGYLMFRLGIYFPWVLEFGAIMKAATVLQIVLAALCGRDLWRRLNNRAFAMATSG
jgi:ABC-type transport system involved in multi-copper enzyme maturation permease subunit